MSCILCDSTVLETFLDLGTAPPSNAYVNNLAYKESYYPLHAKVCTKCWLVQLDEMYEPPDDIFTEYGYFSSQSQSWLEHSKRYVEMITEKVHPTNVCELASNDGYLLQYFDPSIHVTGIEPAKNIAQVAIKKNIPTLMDFWSVDLIDKHQLRGTFDLIIANNVLAHTPYLNGFVEAVELALMPGGIATFEVPHLMNLIEKNQWDTIYHEHFSYFSFIVLLKLFAKHNLFVFEVEKIPTHGGSLRLYVSRQDDTRYRMHSNSVAHKLIREEGDKGYASIDLYKNFNKGVKRQKQDILWTLLVAAKAQGKQVVCYGAPAKGNTVLNYCGIDSDLISYCVDTTPYKQQKYLPGSRIPIYHPDKILETKPDIIWVMPWNHKEEIMKKLVFDWQPEILIGPTMEPYYVS